MFPQLADRLKKELSTQFPENWKIHIRQPSGYEARYCAWIGASVLSQVPDKRWITKEDYDEYGPQALKYVGDGSVTFEIKENKTEYTKTENLAEAGKPENKDTSTRAEEIQKENKEEAETETEVEEGIKHRTADCNVLYLPLGELEKVSGGEGMVKKKTKKFTFTVEDLPTRCESCKFVLNATSTDLVKGMPFLDHHDHD